MDEASEAKKIVAESGNSFHARVATWFIEKDWHVSISPYYMDQSQGKARELDLVVEKLYHIENHGSRTREVIVVRLFVECKFVAAPAVFWFTDRDMAAAEALVCAGGVFRRTNTYTNRHHYLSRPPRVAKLFSSAGGRGQENDPFFRAINQSLNAMVSMRPQGASIPAIRERQLAVKHILTFPVVICSSFDKLFSVDFGSNADPVRISDHFHLDVSYAYVDAGSRSQNEHFLIDFVDFSKIDTFEAELNEDGSIAAFLSGN